MKRTPLWVFVAAAAVQIAALGLCVWAMENFGHLDGEERAEEEPAPAPPRRDVLNPAPAVAAGPVFTPPPPPAPDPVQAYRPPDPPPPVPIFGPPPERPVPVAQQPAPSNPGSADLRYVTEAADDATQIVHAEFNGRIVAFGFYADGNIRFVDVDGGRYAGKADSARARMREAGGTRAFTVQIGIAADGRLQATFTGGLHDAETLPLEPLVGWSIA